MRGTNFSDAALQNLKVTFRLGPLKRSAVVYDVVYVPLETALLAQARARGNRIVDGRSLMPASAASFA